MLTTFDKLGHDAMARIDARLWADYYRKKVARLGRNVASVRPEPGWLLSLKTRVTRYMPEDKQERAVLLWTDYERLLKKVTK